MKAHIFFLLAWLSVAPLFAQNTFLRGRVMDEKKEILTYATVLLMQDGIIVAGTYTDESGVFVFALNKAGKFDLKISLTGYEQKLIKDIELKADENKEVEVELKATKAVAVKNSKAPYPTLGGVEGSEGMDGDMSIITGDTPASLGDMEEMPVSVTTKVSPKPVAPAAMAAAPMRSVGDARMMKGITTSSAAGDDFGGERSKKLERAESYYDAKREKTKPSPTKKDKDGTKTPDITVPDKNTPVPSDLAGKLTAGEVNDFNKWKMWKGITKDEFKDFENVWKMIPQERYVLQVENKQHHPMHNVKVELRNETEVIWTTRTDNTGKAELWANFFQQLPQAKGAPTFIRIYSDGKAQDLGQIMPFSRGINRMTVDKSCDYNKQVDIAFVVDATGSMGDEIAHIRADLNLISDKLKDTLRNWDIRFGAVFYQDKGDAYLAKATPMSADVKQSQKFMQETPWGGGGDFPEAVEAGLEEAVQKLKWNDNAVARIVFLVLDAPAHEDLETLMKLQMQIRAAAHKGIRIVPVACSGIDKSTEFLLRATALATNGTYAFLTDDSGIGNPHIKPSTDEFKVEKFYQLAIRIAMQYTYQPDCKPAKDPKPIKEIVHQRKVIEKPEDKLKKDDVVLQKDTANKIVYVEQKTISWKYYPNPTKGNLNIEVEDKIGELFLCDLSGKVLERYDLKNLPSLEIDISAYANGIYFLRYEYAPDKWLSGKVILER